MQMVAKANTKNELHIVDKIFGADLFLQSKENTHIVARNMNVVALIICFSYATYLLLTGRMSMTFPGIFTCYLPSLLCIVTDIILRTVNLYTSMLFTFITVPLSITLKGIYEPIPGLMLFPFTYGIVCFFLLPTRPLIYIIYSLSALCFTAIDLAYHYVYNQHFRENISLIIFNDLIFAFLVYTVLGYLRNLLTKFRHQRKIKEQEMITQNLELQTQQEEIANQNLLLQQKNQLLIESWHFQQKITSVLSHDTRTSLIFLKHIVLSTKRMKENNPETQELLSELDREISNMTNTFDHILQWLKKPSYINNIEKEEIILQELAEEIIFSYKGQVKNKELLLINKIHSSLKLHINQEYLKVILRNIVGNAIKFSNRGGIVTLWAEKSDSWFKIYIRDNGIGITAANLKKINEGVGFSTPGTLQETGTGMGLIFCRDFIEKNAGSLEIISASYSGTTVIISLPSRSLNELTTDKIPFNVQKN